MYELIITDIEQYLAARTTAEEAAVLILLDERATGIYIDSMRTIRAESSRTISIGHDSVPFFAYPANLAYYLNLDE